MMEHQNLVRLLADGRLHSGSWLARQMGVTRAAIWKQARALAAMGLEVEAVRGRGYRFCRSFELLDAAQIRALLDPPSRSACGHLDVAWVTDSTNAAMARSGISPSVGCWHGLAAEFQTAGRGRQGRRWVSPLGSGLCLSMSWCFPAAPRDLPALSLAVGVGVLEALAAAGARGLQLKWPNDVLANGAKVAGILVDVDGEVAGPLRAVIGVGVNLALPAGACEQVLAEGGLPPAGLESAACAALPGRNQLAANLFASIHQVVADFSDQGFAAFADRWRRHDCFAGRELRVRAGTREITGTGCGVDASGAMQLQTPGGLVPVFNGDVTLRADA